MIYQLARIIAEEDPAYGKFLWVQEGEPQVRHSKYAGVPGPDGHMQLTEVEPEEVADIPSYVTTLFIKGDSGRYQPLGISANLVELRPHFTRFPEGFKFEDWFTSDFAATGPQEED